MRYRSMIVFLLPATLIFLRLPEQFLQAQFWAEDGTVFFQDAFERGALRLLAESYSGYLHTLPRLVAGISLLVPLEHAPLVFNLAAYLIMVVPTLYLMSDRMAREVPSVTGRVLCAVIYAALPASDSTYANITNAQWHLAVTACLICASSPPCSMLQRWADAILLGLCALSSPLGAIFLPIVIWKAVKERRGTGGAEPFAVLAVVCLGIAIQAVGTIGSLRIVHAAHPATNTILLIREVVMFGFFNAILGVSGNLKHYASFGVAIYLLGLAALLFLVIAAIRFGSRLLLMLLYAAIAVFILRHVFPIPNQGYPTIPNVDTRYYHIMVLFTLLASLLVVLRGGRFRYAGMVILAPAIFIGIRGDYLLGPPLDTHYADQIAVFRTLPKGTSFSLPILPVPWRVVLTSREEPRGSSPLEHRRALAKGTYSYLAPVEVPHRGLDWVAAKGLAIDEPAGKPAGGVFVVVDGRLFPAVTGLAAVTNQNTIPPKLKNAAFTRDIPLQELGPGLHTAHLIILSHDRSSYFLPTRTTMFELP